MTKRAPKIISINKDIIAMFEQQVEVKSASTYERFKKANKQQLNKTMA